MTGDWTPGQVVLGLYEIRGTLGTGGMGTVYRVHHRGWKMDLAVKCPLAHRFASATAQQAFMQEAEAWVNVGLHPHTVSCYYVRTIDGLPRLFAELVEGGSLLDWIENGKLYQGGEAVALARILDVAIQMAWGLQHAHALGLLHRDVKPANVMMTPEGTAKVTDFGLALALSRSAEGTGEAVADMANRRALYTLEYASPEQLDGLPQLTPAADVWCWAVSVLHMFTGQLPTYGALAATLLRRALEDGPAGAGRPPLPRGVIDVLRRCFRDAPSARPTDLGQMAYELMEIYLAAVGEVYPRRRPRMAGLAGDCLNNRAVSLFDLGRTAEALDLLDEALRVHPSHVPASYNRGLCRWRQGELTDVQLLGMLRNLERTERDWHVPLLEAWVHDERGDADSARFMATQARLQADHDAEAEELIDATLQTLGDGLAAGRPLTAHHPVTALVVGLEGRRAMAASQDGTLRCWDLQNGATVYSIHRHGDTVKELTLTANDSVLVSLDVQGVLQLWNAYNGRPLHSHAEVRAVASARTLPLLLTGGMDGQGRLHDLSSPSVPVFSTQGSPVERVAFHEATGAWAYSAADQLTVGTRSPDRVPWSTPQAVSCMAFSSDGEKLFTGTYDGWMRAWDRASGAMCYEVRGHTGPVLGLAVTHAGTLWSCGRDGQLRGWEMLTGRCLRTIDPGAGVLYDVAASPSGSIVAVAGADARVHWWRAHLALPQAPFSFARPARSEEIVRGQSELELAVRRAEAALREGDDDLALRWARTARQLPHHQRDAGGLRLWQTLLGRGGRGGLLDAWPLFLASRTGPVRAVTLVVDGATCFSGGDDGIQRWDVPSGRLVQEVPPQGSGIVSLVVGAEVGVLTLDADGQCQWWDPVGLSCLQTVSTRTVSLQLSDDGLTMVLVSRTHVDVRHAVTGELVQTFPLAVTAAWISEDGMHLMTGAQDGMVRMWEVSTGRCLWQAPGHQGAVRSLAGRGAVLISGGEDQKMRVWDVVRGQSVRSLGGHGRSVTHVALSRDGTVLLSASKDKTMRVWDLRRGTAVRVLQPGHDRVESLALQGLGMVAVCGTKDGQVSAYYLDWDVEEHGPEARPSNLAQPPRTAETATELLQ